METEVYDPNRRQHYSFEQAGEDLIVDIRIAPGGDGPPHFHPAIEERWTLLEGRVRFKVGKEKVEPGLGEELCVAAGVRHSFSNVGDQEARVRAVVSPAGSMQGFLEEAAALSRAGCYTRHGLVTGPRAAMRMAEFIERYRGDAVLLWPPRSAQRVLIAVRRMLGTKGGATRR